MSDNKIKLGSKLEKNEYIITMNNQILIINHFLNKNNV